VALCSQEDIEIRLQRDLTADAPTITGTVDALIEAAQLLIEAELRRPVESDDREETLDGGRVTYFLRFWPVTAVTSLTEDGEALTEDEDFLFYPNGKLIRVSGGHQTLWRTRKRQGIHVEYVGGYAPEELGHLGGLCAEIVARAIRRGQDMETIPPGAAGAVQSVSATGSDTVSYATGGNATVSTLQRFVFLEEGERDLLEPYKRRWLGFA
jgi:hypothetical protein